MTGRCKDSGTALLGCFLLAFATMACRRQTTPRGASPSLGGETTTRPMADRPLGRKRAPGSAANVLIIPRVNGTTKSLVLAFCYEDDTQYDPQIYRLRVARTSLPKAACEIAAIGNAWLWKEWAVGSVPTGFRLVECGPLAPGEYEVYVDAFVGDGVVRMSIDNDGSVRRLPWDSFDTAHLRSCPRVERSIANTIPHVDSGGEGILERRAREIREERPDVRR